MRRGRTQTAAPPSLARRSVLGAGAALAALAAVGCGTRPELVLRGAGATLPHRLYSRWIERYEAIAPTVHVDYQAVGSASGLRHLYARMADFGASDAAARGAPFELLHLPTALGAVALAHRLPGLDAPLVLRPTAIAAIFSGAAHRWNDARIAKDNPGVALPDLPVVPVFRSDGSGATQIFTEWLSACAGTPPGGMVAHFPAGLGARGSDGVAAAVSRIPGALGYVEAAHARAARLAIAEIASRDDARPVALTDENVDLAATSLPPDRPLTMRLGSDTEGSYPLSSFTYLLVARDTPDDGRSSALARFFFWALGPGQDDCARLGYRPLPAVVAVRARQILARDLRAGSHPALRAD